MRTLFRIILTLLAVLAIGLITSYNKLNSTLFSKNDLSIDTLKTEYLTRATNKHKERIGEEDTLSLSINNYDFTIYPDGLLKWGDKNSVRLSTEMYVIQAYFYITGKDLLLFCEMSDNDVGTCNFYRINLTNGQIKWNANLSGFNLGRPAIRANYVYVTAIGTVGKLDLGTGKYVYEKYDLYDGNSFNYFDTILFREDKIYFVSKSSSDNIVDTIIFNENTNRMTIKKTKIEVITLPPHI